jgi:glycosyltransferase involved in cell wall biosynthesis
MEKIDDFRIAWLLPIAWFYWQPVLSEFTRLFPKTIVYTGFFPGFARCLENSFELEVIGKIKVIEINKDKTGYGDNFTYLSQRVLGRLLKFKPQVIISSSFGIWTILALALKFLGGWRVIIAYEGSSPGVDYRSSPVRLSLRRLMVRMADACITNSKAGQAYLTGVLWARNNYVFVEPYEIPDARTLLIDPEFYKQSDVQRQRPVFLFVGQVVPRKGLQLLLEACNKLQEQGYRHYTLLVVGDGAQRVELEDYCQQQQLTDRVHWLGRVDYNQISACFQQADVFILPTLEDTWGVVVLEAMLFGKPVLCSSGAGTSELVTDGENGYVFDPQKPVMLAELMQKFIDRPDLIEIMGEKSRQVMERHTPQIAANRLARITEWVLGRRENP